MRNFNTSPFADNFLAKSHKFPRREGGGGIVGVVWPYGGGVHYQYTCKGAQHPPKIPQRDH